MDSVEKRVAELAERLNGELYGNEGCDVLRTAVIESYFKRVRNEALASERRQEWIKVTPETALKVGEKYWVVWNGMIQHCCYVWNGRGFELPQSLDEMIGGGEMPRDEVEYVQPLPPAPEERG